MPINNIFVQFQPVIILPGFNQWLYISPEPPWFTFPLSACRGVQSSRLHYTPATIQPPQSNQTQLAPAPCIHKRIQATKNVWLIHHLRLSHSHEKKKDREKKKKKNTQILSVLRRKSPDNNSLHNRPSDFHLTPSERNQPPLSISPQRANHSTIQQSISAVTRPQPFHSGCFELFFAPWLFAVYLHRAVRSQTLKELKEWGQWEEGHLGREFKAQKRESI